MTQSSTDNPDLTEAVASVLDDRGAHQTAQLVRDTDPDDDLWNNYFSPMIDQIESDYTLIVRTQMPGE